MRSETLPIHSTELRLLKLESIDVVFSSGIADSIATTIHMVKIDYCRPFISGNIRIVCLK